MTASLIALSLILGILAVGYARMGKADPNAGFNLKALACLIACIGVAYLSGGHG
jgi:ribose/xylose/arabinose/galactoside ABC-type transport system permease subunit